MIEEKYYENYFSLFLTEGWKQFVQDSQDAYDVIDLERSKDWDSYLVQRTTRQNLKAVIDFEQSIRVAHDNLQEDKDDL
jgi:hypothetical protein